MGFRFLELFDFGSPGTLFSRFQLRIFLPFSLEHVFATTKHILNILSTFCPKISTMEPLEQNLYHSMEPLEQNLVRKSILIKPQCCLEVLDRNPKCP